MTTSYLDIFPGIEDSGMIYTRRDIKILDTAQGNSFEKQKIAPDGSIVNLQKINDEKTSTTPGGRLRVALVECDPQRHVFTGKGFTIPFKHRTNSPHSTLPLSDNTLSELLDKMQLPAATRPRITCTPINYLSHYLQVFRPRKSQRRRLGITMKMPDSSVVVGTTMALSLSHCHETNATEALILCSSESGLQKIADMILSTQSLTTHPAALPVIVAGLYANVVSQRMELTWQETFQLETASGQSGIIIAADGTEVATGNPLQAAALPRVRNGDVEMDVITSAEGRVSGSGKEPSRAEQLELIARSIGWAQLALGWQNYTQVLADILGHINVFLESDAGQLLSSQSAISLVQEDQKFALQEQVDFLSQKAAGLILQARYLHGRLELQSTAVNNLRAFDLANNMKYISVLALLFLPAACIAGIYTVPSELISRYWITTAVITVLILVVSFPMFRPR